ncbi:myeloid-associated differentiation marker homolog [Strigops habroptila]|uniref:Myeloid associated differentiation marker n=1 Tax=Strigops habroptila TaxID=2489341 RepID=A0A672U555_STRHB|nr:myeloid-associated differentiation marker homolog [Strigops habroptila]
MPLRCPPPPPSPLRCAQALSCCVAFSTAAAAGRWAPGEGAGCVSAWALAFAGSALLLGAEALGRLPPRRDLPLAHAAAAATACAAATVLWPLGHLRGDDGGDGARGRALRVTAAAASGLAAALYGAEVLRDRARPGQPAPYMATPPGLLKVVETVLGLLLLGLAAEQGAGAGPEAWRWCLGIYCVSFAVGLVLVVGCLWGCGACGCGQDPAGARRALGLYAAAGLVAYGAAAVLWPLYGFREELGGRARRPAGCGPGCAWDRAVLVAVLTALNLLVYGADLGHSGRLVLLRG